MCGQAGGGAEGKGKRASQAGSMPGAWARSHHPEFMT